MYFLFALYKNSCTFVMSNNTSNMKTSKTTTNYTKSLSVVIPRNNGTQAGINALAASLLRGIK